MARISAIDELNCHRINVKSQNRKLESDLKVIQKREAGAIRSQCVSEVNVLKDLYGSLKNQHKTMQKKFRYRRR